MCSPSHNLIIQGLISMMRYIPIFTAKKLSAFQPHSCVLCSQGNNLLGFVKTTNDGNTNLSQIDNARKEKDNDVWDLTHTLWFYIQLAYKSVGFEQCAHPWPCKNNVLAGFFYSHPSDNMITHRSMIPDFNSSCVLQSSLHFLTTPQNPLTNFKYIIVEKVLHAAELPL